MTHIAEPRVIGNHADMGPSIRPDVPEVKGAQELRPDASDTNADQATWDSEGGALRPDDVLVGRP
ncbi:uncharacterized protein RMCC_4191 [Mycolicibacterium canariasense]|uniref:Uncharacterized protein n=1 Tax=Mycolicibacterium canariasense TaxID=228230 RepID=A0A100WFK8_MYCCR|nr:hypothetical protein [Mycolicibacterium canariasense]MCV7211204.1 hypothetical protein [Mycolicibacterium canariasense]ORV03267.1 hypothetical protein AWB94_24470 [Mycolicibacterium canariasense]GAS97225.1 uncharacterized protein RMCC_4191 [Mycolicibacterium canariasense]